MDDAPDKPPVRVLQVLTCDAPGGTEQMVATLSERVDRSRVVCEVVTLERITAAAFGQRRKMLRQSLKSLGVDVSKLLAESGIEGTRRAEEIDVAGFVAIANAYASISSSPTNRR